MKSDQSVNFLMTSEFPIRAPSIPILKYLLFPKQIKHVFVYQSHDRIESICKI